LLLISKAVGISIGKGGIGTNGTRRDTTRTIREISTSSITTITVVDGARVRITVRKRIRVSSVSHFVWFENKIKEIISSFQ
jgi:hypothetical protein